MLKIAGLLFYTATFLLLLGDSFYYPASSTKYFFIDSRFLYLIFITTGIVFSFLNRRILPDWCIKLNNYLIFPATALIFIPIALINGLTYQYFAFNTFGMNLENFKYLFYISGFVLMANIKADWLKTNSQKLLYFGGILYLNTLTLLEIFNSSLYDSLIKEDGILENIQLVSYLAGFILALLCAFYLLRNSKKLQSLFFLFMAIGLFFIAGEEISWGQRIFNIQTPQELARINYQQELTIHNVETFQEKIDYIYMLIGICGAFAGIFFKTFIPAFYKKYSQIFPPAILFFYFFAVSRFYFLNKFVVFNYKLFSFEKVGIGNRQEVSETLLAFGFFAFAFLTYRALTKKKH